MGCILVISADDKTRRALSGKFAAMTKQDPPTPKYPPLLLTVPAALATASLGRTKFYELVRLGLIKPVKLGRRTFVLYSEIERWVASLPALGQHDCQNDVPTKDSPASGKANTKKTI
jgi:predicted DNA-binding transcriptional regulator AlpA